MNDTPKLEPCPFCGGPAETDWRQGYCSLEGKLGNAAAIYCTKCSAQISACYADMRDMPEESVQAFVLEQWNRRPSPLPSADARDGEALISAIRELAQTLLEMQHINEVGERWFTRGDEGMRRQFWMWIQRGQKALGDIDVKALEALASRTQGDARDAERITELEKRVAELTPAADCWNALARCYRMTFMGSAGCNPPPGFEGESRPAHITMNFWTAPPGYPDAEMDQGKQDTAGRSQFGNFMAVALANAALAGAKP